MSQTKNIITSVDAIVLIHPEYDLRDSNGYNLDCLTYINNLRKATELAKHNKINIYAIPDYEKRFELPKDLTDQWKYMPPEFFHPHPELSLMIMSLDIKKRIPDLKIGLGGMYETRCVSLYGQYAFHKYIGKKAIENAQKDIEEMKNIEKQIQFILPEVEIKGALGQVISSITRDKLLK